MTVPARITQADITRVTKAAKAAGWCDAQIIVNFQHQTIAIMPGQGSSLHSPNPFDGE
jgi:hypothetical protein